MEQYLGLAAFLWGAAIWLPFCPRVVGQDLARAILGADMVRRGKTIPYRGCSLGAPGVYLHLHLFLRIFSRENILALYVMLAILSGCTSLLCFWVARTLWGPGAGLAASALLGFYLVHPRLNGNWAPNEQLMALPLLGSLLLILAYEGNPSWWLPLAAGACYSYAPFIKQTAVVFLPGYLLFGWGAGYGPAETALFMAGVLLWQALAAAYYAVRHRALAEYLYNVWLFWLPMTLFPSGCGGLYPGESRKEQAKNHGQTLAKLAPLLICLSPLLILSAVGFAMLLSGNFSAFSLGLGWCFAAAWLPAFLRRIFWPQYLLLAVPWLSLVAGHALAEASRGLSGPPLVQAASAAFLSSAAILSALAIWWDRRFFALGGDAFAWLRKAHGETMAKMHRNCREAADLIARQSAPHHTVLVCGNAPQVILFSRRDSFDPALSRTLAQYLETYSLPDTSLAPSVQEKFQWLLKGPLKLHPRPNPLLEGYPDLILLGDGSRDLGEFQRLTGIKYAPDPAFAGMPVFRADPEAEELMKLYQESKDRSPNPTPEILADQRGLLAGLKAGNWNQAYFCLKSLIAHDPVKVNYALLLGDCLARQGKAGLFVRLARYLLHRKFFPGAEATHLLAKLAEMETACGDMKSAHARMHGDPKGKPTSAEAGRTPAWLDSGALPAKTAARG